MKEIVYNNIQIAKINQLYYVIRIYSTDNIAVKIQQGIHHTTLLKTRYLGRWEEVADVSELVVDHKSQKTHHGGTALVQLNGTLLKLGLFIEAVPAEVKGSVAEVTWEFSSGDVLHDGQFKEANEGEDLKGSSNWNLGGSLPAGGDVRELGSRHVNVSWKADSGSGGQVSDNTKHADTSVLDLDVTKTVELFLVTILNKAKRIEESKRRLGTKGILEGVQGGGLGSLLDRGEGRGSSDKGGKDGGLHVDSLYLTNL